MLERLSLLVAGLAGLIAGCVFVVGPPTLSPCRRPP